MGKHNLSAKQVAEILDVKPQTVRLWRTLNGQAIPDRALELLELKLK